MKRSLLMPVIDDIQLEGHGLYFAFLVTDMARNAHKIASFGPWERNVLSLEIRREIRGDLVEGAQLQIKEQHDVTPFTGGNQNGHASVKVGHRLKDDAYLRIFLRPH